MGRGKPLVLCAVSFTWFLCWSLRLVPKLRAVTSDAINADGKIPLCCVDVKPCGKYIPRGGVTVS